MLLAVVTGAAATMLSYAGGGDTGLLSGTARVMAVLILAFFLQIIIHEGGHLVFGLLTGYTFSSFRILSLIFKKVNGRIAVRKLTLSGTAGQCLMGPPELVDGKIPYVLYNLGGVLMNLISAAVSALVCLLLGNAGKSWYFFAVLAMTGIYLALTNGIPFGGGAVPNDGYNALNLGRDPEAVSAFWKQLKISQQQSEGIRLKDMPDEWFSPGEGADPGDLMTATLIVFDENRDMDSGRFGDALEKIRMLTSDGITIPPLHRALLENDAVFIDALEKGKEADTSSIRDGKTAVILKQMKGYPAVIRTEYAIASLVQEDLAAADTVMKAFEKAAKSYPNEVEIESERELIRLVDDKRSDADRQ